MQINELFKKLVESELLTEETRGELEKEFTAVLAEAVEAAKKEAEDKVRLEMTEQFVADKEALIEALDTKVTEFLNKHVVELKDDIDRFRDLEVEYNNKLVEAKKSMADTVKKDMSTLVDRLDEFLEQRLNVEFQELKEDIEQVKKLEFGRKIFEAVSAEYGKKFVNENETAIALAKAQEDAVKAQEETKNAQKVLEGVNKELAAVKRDQKLATVLESLTGKPKEVMQLLLANVPTDKLDETYAKYIGKVLHESVATSKVEVSTKSEKEEDANPSVLAEGKNNSTGEDLAATKVVTGDTPVLESEKVDETPASRLDESKKEHIRKLAGII